MSVVLSWCQIGSGLLTHRGWRIYISFWKNDFNSIMLLRSVFFFFISKFFFSVCQMIGWILWVKIDFLRLKKDRWTENIVILGCDLMSFLWHKDIRITRVYSMTRDDTQPVEKTSPFFCTFVRDESLIFF